MQPLDVGVFQALKGWHSRVIEEHVRAGQTTFSKAEFISKIYKICIKGIKPATIQSA
jgi:hypothetical protein